MKTRGRSQASGLRGPKFSLVVLAVCAAAANGEITWERRSSISGDMPVPNTGKQQTCCLAMDIDKDGITDFVVGERTQAPSVVWYKYNGQKWDRFVIDDTRKNPEAGGDFYDIDRDGDLDIILGQDASGNAIWWWENPYPDFSKPWMCRHIKNTGGRKHHDQTIADYDGDGQVEFVSWNQQARQLLLFEIPSDPKSTQPWPSTVIYSWSSGQEREGFPSIPVDIDLDGKVDIVGGGRWFKHKGGAEFEEQVIDGQMAFTQCAAGQLVKGGRPEVVFSPGDMDGPAKWYEWTGAEWTAHVLREVIHGHTCEIRDIDSDGNLDIMIGEMGNPGAGDNAATYIWYGDGQGRFKETVASHGQGIHEGKLADLDGDGDLDILMKPYSHNTPRIDILLNGGTHLAGSASVAGGRSFGSAASLRTAALPRRNAIDGVLAGWQVLFDGTDLSKWQDAAGGAPNANWVIEDGALTRRPPKAGMIWSKQRFGDFVLDLEFKTEGNSGIFFRADDMKDAVQTGIEIQVYKRVDKPTTHSCGAVYDALAPSKEVTIDGQWNHITITAVDNKIGIVMNGEQIIDMDLNHWAEAGKNPDGSKNKFRRALKDFRREGYIGFQDHGANVCFRSVRIKPL